MTIEPMSASDWPEVAAIYAEGITTGDATFEQAVPEWADWDVNHLPECRLVARDDAGRILGWAALSPVSERCVYEGVAEVSVYVSSGARRGGLGRTLLERLIGASEEAGLWTLQAGIFPENEGSLAIHLALGFRVVGLRERLGMLNGRWRDVMLLERRSSVTGI